MRTYKEIKSNLEQDISNCSETNLSINDALEIIKVSIVDVICLSGNIGKGNLIKTKKLINLLHEVVKSEFSKLGVNENLIVPPKGHSNGELKLAGLLKNKNQDVSITPNNETEASEVLLTDGILKYTVDEYGQLLTEKTLTVNVRSQLSSFAKNFDTLYERTFAESFNLHKRCPNMVLGEFYMIAVNEFDVEAAKEKTVDFTRTSNVAKHIEKYLLAFDAINQRNARQDEFHKYEKVCLLIVDFETLKIYDNDADLLKDGLLPFVSSATISNLTFDSFFHDLLEEYSARFGEGRFN